MFEFEKALKYLKAIKTEAMENGDSFVGTNNIPNINIAILALNRQICKKPVYTTHLYRYAGEEGSYKLHHCPVCFDNPKYSYFESLLDKGVKYCRRCGQAIDWNEENNANE